MALACQDPAPQLLFIPHIAVVTLHDDAPPAFSVLGRAVRASRSADGLSREGRAWHPAPPQ